MICTKCNSILPDGAKFCTECGALTSFSEEARCVCKNCGLELPKGAKFCAVCGAAAEEKAPAPVSAVNLEKKEAPRGEMPAATAAPVRPAPVSSGMPAVGGMSETPAPAPRTTAPAPMPAPAAPTITPPPMGYSAPSAGLSDAPLGGFGGGAVAAAAVTPVKKKHVLRTVLLSVGGVIAALAVAALVIFFLNKQLFYRIFLGNSGCAGMIESNSIKEITNNIDKDALANGLKNASSSYSSILSGMGMSGYGGYTNLSYGGRGVVTDTNMASAGGVAGSSVMGSAGTLVNTYIGSLKDALGNTSSRSEMTVNVELTDAAKALIKSSGISEKELDDLISDINSSSFEASVTSGDNAVSTYMNMKGGKLSLDIKTIIDANGNCYISFPFASEKAVLIKAGGIGGNYYGNSYVSDSSIEFDGDKIGALINKLVDVYVKHYKSAAVIEDGELDVAGSIAKGQLITANMRGETLTKMFADMGETIANDDYFCKQFAELFQSLGLTVSAKDIGSAIKTVFSFITVPDSEALCVRTVINNNCDVLAKSYEIITGNQSAVCVSWLNGNDRFAAEISAGGKKFATVSTEKKSETEGNCAVNIYSGSETASFNVKYSDFKKTQFRGKDAYTGTFEITTVVPADFTQGGAMPSEIEALLSSSKIVVSSKITSDSETESTIAFESSQYGKAAVTIKSSITDGTGVVEIPSKVIDVTPYANGSISVGADDELIGLLEDIEKAIGAQGGGDFAKKLEEMLDGTINPAASESDCDELRRRIADRLAEIEKYPEVYNIDSDELADAVDALASEFEGLKNELLAGGNSIKLSEFEALLEEYDDLYDAMEALKSELMEAMIGDPSVSGSSYADIDFDSLSVKEFGKYYEEYSARYTAVVYKESVRKKIAETEEGEALLDEANACYEKAKDTADKFYDIYNRAHSLDVSRFRNAKKALKELAKIVDSLEKAASGISNA